MGTESLTQGVESDIIRPDVGDWSEFEDGGDYYLLTMYMYEPYHLKCLILKRANSSPKTFRGRIESHYKIIGYYRYFRSPKSGGDFLKRFKKKTISLR
jgi:hypothetical protein